MHWANYYFYCCCCFLITQILKHYSNVSALKHSHNKTTKFPWVLLLEKKKAAARYNLIFSAIEVYGGTNINNYNSNSSPRESLPRPTSISTTMYYYITYLMILLFAWYKSWAQLTLCWVLLPLLIVRNNIIIFFSASVIHHLLLLDY
jgi:hypothetical protein